MVLVFVSLLKVLQQFEENWFSHLKPSLLCLLEEIAVLVLQFLALQSSPIELHFLLVTQMRSAFLFWFLLSCRRRSHRVLINAIVVLPILVDLHLHGVVL